MNIFYFKYLLLFLLVTLPVSNSAQNTITLSNNFQSINIGDKIEILYDKTGELTIKEILSYKYSSKFLPSDEDEPNFGFTAAVYWIRFQTENLMESNPGTYLEVSYPLLDSIELYIPDNSGSWVIKRNGDHYPFDSRDIKHRNFIFRIDQPPGKQNCYMRFQTTSSMNFPLTLWSEEALINKIGLEQILFGIFFGAVIIMIIYNIFLFIGLKDISFIYLFLFIMSWGFAQFTIDGLSFQYLWSGFTWWADINLPVFIFASLITAVQFCRSLLNTSVIFPSWDPVLRIERNFFIAGLIISFFLNYALSIKLAAGMAIPAIISLSVTGAAGLKIKNRSAVIFLAAWGLFLAGAILFAFKSFGLLPSSYLTNFGVQIGFFAMMILLSIAVQDRVETEKKEKENAQAKLIENLQESEKVLAQKVEERTDEINRINILLMDRAIELAGINRLTEKVNSSLRLNDVLLFACQEFVKIFPVKYSAIYLLNERKNKFELSSYYSGEEKQKFNIPGEFIYEQINDSSDISKINNQLLNDENFLVVPVILLKRMIGVIVLPFTDPAHNFSKDETDLVRTMAVQVAGAVQNAKQFSETENALDIAERDLEIGREIQSGFFPSSMPRIKGWEIDAGFKGARQVAGDFYDVFRLDDSKLTAFIIADVCDKGVGAALFMVVFRSLLRAYSENTITASDIKSGMQKVMLETNNYIAGTHNSSNMFASVFYGIIHHSGSDIYYINAGHDSPVILDETGNIKIRLVPTGPAAGMFPDMKFEVECIHLDKGNILFAFTDGSTDARNDNNELFTEDKLLEVLKRPWTSAYSLLFDVSSALKKHMGSTSQFDDITHLCIRRKKSADDNIFSIERRALPDNLIDLRDFIEGAALKQQLEKETVFAFKLAAEEICSNIINYGFKEDKGFIKLILEVCEDRTILKIIDNGTHFPPESAEIPDIKSEAEKRNKGGLGIYLVKELMNDVAYEKDEEGNNLLILSRESGSDSVVT